MPRPGYSPVDRAATLEELVAELSTIPGAMGVLIVGSGAIGFRDEWSDLDLVVVAGAEYFASVLNATRDDVLPALHPKFLTSYQHRPDVVVLCALLPNQLNVDLGVWSIDVLFASSPNWSVVWTRDSTARTAIEKAMTEHPPAQREGEPIISGDDPAWQRAYRARRPEIRKPGVPTPGY